MFVHDNTKNPENKKVTVLSITAAINMIPESTKNLAQYSLITRGDNPAGNLGTNVARNNSDNLNASLLASIIAKVEKIAAGKIMAALNAMPFNA